MKTRKIDYLNIWPEVLLYKVIQCDIMQLNQYYFGEQILGKKNLISQKPL